MIIPLPHYDNFFEKCLKSEEKKKEKKGSSEPPPPPRLSDFFRAGAKFLGSRSSSETFCPPPPLSKHPGRNWYGNKTCSYSQLSKLQYFLLSLFHTRERRLFWVFGLAFQSREKKHGSFVFFWRADCYFIWERIFIRKCVRNRRSHCSAPPPPPKKSQFRGQGIHTAISRLDLRDLCVIWIAQFKFAFVMLICIHTGQIHYIWPFQMLVQSSFLATNLPVSRQQVA